MTAYSLTVIEKAGTPTLAIEVGGSLYDIAAVAPELARNPELGLLGILQDWDVARAALSRVADNIASDGGPSPYPEADIAYGRLISHPAKIICAGLNYHDHLTDDLGIMDFDKNAVDPLFFMKQKGAQVAAGKQIPFPRQTTQLDWEVELVVIIGRGGRFIEAKDAMGHVAGYAIGFDLSARDWQMSERHMRKFDLFGGKAFDGSAPVGPKFVPAEFVDASDLPLRLWVNDELKQDSSTARMIWSIPELIEAISLHMELEPGDMIFSGSPAGVGLVSNTYLKPGDVVRGEIPGLGQLVTPIAVR